MFRIFFSRRFCRLETIIAQGFTGHKRSFLKGSLARNDDHPIVLPDSQSTPILLESLAKVTCNPARLLLLKDLPGNHFHQTRRSPNQSHSLGFRAFHFFLGPHLWGSPSSSSWILLKLLHQFLRIQTTPTCSSPSGHQAPALLNSPPHR